MSTNNPPVAAYIAFALVSFFWGTTYLAIRVAVEHMPPLMLAGLRQVIAGLIFCTYFWLRKEKLPELRYLKNIALNSFLMIVLGNGLVTWAEQYISSGLTALLCSLTPFWIILINRMSNRGQAVNYKATIGIGLGVIGMILIFSRNISDFTNPEYLGGIVAIVAANIGWAIGTVNLGKQGGNAAPLYAAGLQMLFAGIILVPLSLLTESWNIETIPAESWLMLGYLLVFGSLVAYGAYVYALQHLPTTFVSVYAYINTMVALVLGWLLLGEELGWLMGAGAVVTILGVYLVNNAYRKVS